MAADKDRKRSGGAGGGPRSREGKAVSSLNALRHGLTSAKARLLEWENPREFNALRDELVIELQPEGMVEAMLVDRITWCAWRLRRAVRIEQLLMGAAPGAPVIRVEWCDNLGEGEDGEVAPPAATESEPDAAEEDPDTRERDGLSRFGRDAGLLVRYEAALERSFYRALWELQERQERRRASTKGPKSGPGFPRA
jgi:hypothetical protein